MQNRTREVKYALRQQRGGFAQVFQSIIDDLFTDGYRAVISDIISFYSIALSLPGDVSVRLWTGPAGLIAAEISGAETRRIDEATADGIVEFIRGNIAASLTPDMSRGARAVRQVRWLGTVIDELVRDRTKHTARLTELEGRIAELTANLANLAAVVEDLALAVKYAPGGAEYAAAADSFHDLAGAQI